MKLDTFRIIKSNEILENWMFIEIVADSGLSGYGEISSAPCNVEPVVDLSWNCLQGLMGRDLDYDLISNWDSCVRVQHSITRSTVLSGIDQALLDLFTRSMGIPLYAFLGGVEKTIPLYANINRALRKNRDNGILKEHILQAHNFGFKNIKIAPFDTLSPEFSDDALQMEINNAVSRIKMALTIMNGGNVAIDCHQRFNKQSAELFINKLKQDDLPLEYIEDVLAYTDENNEFISYLSRKYGFTFAGGETCISETEVRKIADNRCFRIMNPDIKFIGRICDFIKLYHSLKEQGIIIRPHNPTSPIATAFSAAVISCLHDDTMLEFAFGNQNVRNRLIGEDERIEGENYVISDSPGIGIEIAEDFIEEDCLIYTGSTWMKGHNKR